MVDFSSFGDRFDIKALIAKLKHADTRVLLAGGVSLVAVCSLVYYKLKPEKNEMLKEEDLSGRQIIKLSGDESGMVGLSIPPANTLSWYRGDVETASKYLKVRVEEICRKNMWLCARLNQIESHGFCYVYEDSIDEVFKVVSQDKSSISRSTSLDELYTLCTPYLVKAGKAEKEPFRVTVIPSKEEDGYYALIVSMSHVLGDGHTFFTIQSMLSSELPTITMKANRDTESLKIIHKEMVGKETNAFFASPAIICWAISSYVYKWLFNVKNKSLFFEIDSTTIAEEKKNTHGLPFVSTNDILTSWFLRASKADLGMMSINFRNRLKTLTEEMAGNYQHGILYRPPDYKDAAMIRKSLENTHRASEPETSLPTVWELTGGKFNMVTNWASFSKQITIPESVEELHIPIVDMGFSPPGQVMMIIFRYNMDRIAVNLGGTTENMKLIQDSSLLGKKLNQLSTLYKLSGTKHKSPSWFSKIQNS